MIRTVGPEAGDDVVEHVAASARAAGHEVRLVRARGTKRTTIDAFARALDFPSWHGHTLDALEECLRDWALAADGPQTLVVDRAQRLRGHDASGQDGVREVLEDLARDQPDIDIVLIDR